MSEPLTPRRLFELMPSVFQPEKAQNDRAVIQYRLTGDGGGDWYMIVENGACVVKEGLTEQAQATMTVGANDFVELATGRVVWSQKDFGPGGVVLAGGVLVALTDRGEVVLVNPQPAGYTELARFKAIAGKCWNRPVVTDGRVFVRSTCEGACLDLTPAPAQTAVR